MANLAGLLGAFGNAAGGGNEGLLNLGLNLLARSGPSLQPRGFGEILGESMIQSRAMSDAQALRKIREQQEAQQLEMQKLAMQRAQQAMQSREAQAMALRAAGRPRLTEDQPDASGLSTLTPRAPGAVGQLGMAAESLIGQGNLDAAAPLVDMYQGLQPKPSNEKDGYVLGAGGMFVGPDGKILARNPARETPTQEPLVAVQMPDGTSVLLPRSQAIGRAPASPREGALPTEGERTAANYLGRMSEAEKLLGDYVPSITDYAAASKIMSGGSVGSSLANMVLSPKGQQYYQAVADWVRAKLRKESGAVIAPEEMAQETKTYFPIPGDSKETIEQKRQARKQAEAGMRQMSGRAVQPSAQPAAPTERRRVRVDAQGNVIP